MKNLFFRTLLFLFFVNFISCSKDELIESPNNIAPIAEFRTSFDDQFFSVVDIDNFDFYDDFNHKNLNEFARSVYKELERQDKENSFTIDLINRIGTPIWENTLASNDIGSYENYMLIPFDNNSGETSGLIYCVQSSKGEFKFALVEKSVLVNFIQANPTAWNNIASYLAVSFHIFDQLIYSTSNEIIWAYMSDVNFTENTSSRNGCYTYWDCDLLWENDDDTVPVASVDYATGGLTSVSNFIGNVLYNVNSVWLDLFLGGLECIEVEVCPTGSAIIFFDDNWATGYTPVNNSGSNTNESPSGVNIGLNLTLEEKDEFDMQLVLFAREYDLPFSIDELDDWVSYDCMDPNDRLDMNCAWESFLSNFYHEEIDPFLLDLGIDIEDLLNLNFDIAVCLNSNGFGACASESILENRFDVDIVENYIIEGVLMGVDSEGILHVDIEPISMQNSTRLEIFNQLLNVIKATRMLFCEIQSYEPIDLRDYYDDLRTQFWTSTWNGYDDVTLDLPLILSRYIIDTTPEKENPVGTRYVYLWRWKNTNIPGIAISVPGVATSTLDEFVLYDCE